MVLVSSRSLLILGDYINAWSLQQGLKRLGYWARTLPREQYNAIKWETIVGGALFFTDEAGWILAAQQQPPTHFLPRAYNPALIDKLLFAEHLCAIGETPVPFASLNALQAGAFRTPFILKPRLSWVGTRKLPRGVICFTEAESASALAQLQAQGVDRELLFVQQFMPNAENISVSGFYHPQRPERRFFIASRKVLGDGGALSTGVLVATVPPPPGLGARVAHMLDTLNYHGPFEMEFLHDAATNEYLVLELNPRFWMQHGLFISGYENILIRAYLDESFKPSALTDSDYMLPCKPLLWVDRCFPYVALASGARAALRAYFQQIREARRRGYCVYGFPEVGRAARFAMRQLLRRLSRSKKRGTSRSAWNDKEFRAANACHSGRSKESKGS